MENNVNEIFKGWNESCIWSCLQEIMGEIHTNQAEDAAMAIVGDFAFYAGKPSEELVRLKPKSYTENFIVMVPQNEEWAKLIEKCYGDKAKKVTRYAIKKEPGVFNVEELEQAVSDLPAGYELKMIEENEYKMCKEIPWANDFVAQYKDYEIFKKLGLGIVVLKDGEIVAGASSYSTYDKGMEITIYTREDHRRKGLSYVCSAKFILECLKRDLYPSWDARTKVSVALAEKLGYHFSHEYIAYDVDWTICPMT
ncbi:MAG: GNAT family N-acetyltransferase [Lachnospiraceae bacterium]|nr:GNAT family N-acetyltransferase [Lachnospiraceae bacterium]